MSAHVDHSATGRDEVTRRAFLQTTLAGGAALLAGGFPSLLRGANLAGDFPFTETTIPELQRALRSGQWTSASLTGTYLRRIAQLNPLLHAVIETNPDALEIAAQMDRERRVGQLRGPLHGVPILVKDNLATADKMQTTAGSLALVDSVVPADSVVVQK
jgi:amidase